MLFHREGPGNVAGSLELDGLFLSITKAEAGAGISPGLGNGQNGGGVKAAAEEDDPFF